jgi:hypothetical protein
MNEEESFKVTDRRGRGEGVPAAHPSETPGTGGSAAEARDRAREGRPASPAAAGPTDLGALLIMFANSALVSLGAVPEPGTDERRRLDLDQARTAIDILLMLRDKTQGNRTEAESRLLEELVYDLQMRFVRTARGESS